MGLDRANRAIVSALPSGSPKSRVTSESGVSDSSVLGRSEAQTSSTPSLVAASMNASVRYVVVGRRSSNRLAEVGTDLLPARPRGTKLCRACSRVLAGGVVGRVQDLGDLGDLFLDQPLDPGLQRDVRSSAPLAAAPIWR